MQKIKDTALNIYDIGKNAKGAYDGAAKAYKGATKGYKVLTEEASEISSVSDFINFSRNATKAVTDVYTGAYSAVKNVQKIPFIKVADAIYMVTQSETLKVISEEVSDFVVKGVFESWEKDKDYLAIMGQYHELKDTSKVMYTAAKRMFLTPREYGAELVEKVGDLEVGETAIDKLGRIIYKVSGKEIVVADFNKGFLKQDQSKIGVVARLNAYYLSHEQKYDDIYKDKNGNMFVINDKGQVFKIFDRNKRSVIHPVPSSAKGLTPIETGEDAPISKAITKTNEQLHKRVHDLETGKAKADDVVENISFFNKAEKLIKPKNSPDGTVSIELTDLAIAQAVKNGISPERFKAILTQPYDVYYNSLSKNEKDLIDLLMSWEKTAGANMAKLEKLNEIGLLPWAYNDLVKFIEEARKINASYKPSWLKEFELRELMSASNVLSKSIGSITGLFNRGPVAALVTILFSQLVTKVSVTLAKLITRTILYAIGEGIPNTARIGFKVFKDGTITAVKKTGSKAVELADKALRRKFRDFKIPESNPDVQLPDSVIPLPVDQLGNALPPDFPIPALPPIEEQILIPAPVPPSSSLPAVVKEEPQNIFELGKEPEMVTILNGVKKDVGRKYYDNWKKTGKMPTKKALGISQQSPPTQYEVISRLAENDPGYLNFLPKDKTKGAIIPVNIDIDKYPLKFSEADQERFYRLYTIFYSNSRSADIRKNVDRAIEISKNFMNNLPPEVPYWQGMQNTLNVLDQPAVKPDVKIVRPFQSITPSKRRIGEISSTYMNKMKGRAKTVKGPTSHIKQRPKIKTEIKTEVKTEVPAPLEALSIKPDPDIKLEPAPEIKLEPAPEINPVRNPKTPSWVRTRRINGVAEGSMKKLLEMRDSKTLFKRLSKRDQDFINSGGFLTPPDRRDEMIDQIYRRFRELPGKLEREANKILNENVAIRHRNEALGIPTGRMVNGSWVDYTANENILNHKLYLAELDNEVNSFTLINPPQPRAAAPVQPAVAAPRPLTDAELEAEMNTFTVVDLPRPLTDAELEAEMNTFTVVEPPQPLTDAQIDAEMSAFVEVDPDHIFEGVDINRIDELAKTGDRRALAYMRNMYHNIFTEEYNPVYPLRTRVVAAITHHLGNNARIAGIPINTIVNGVSMIKDAAKITPGNVFDFVSGFNKELGVDGTGYISRALNVINKVFSIYTMGKSIASLVAAAPPLASLTPALVAGGAVLGAALVAVGTAVSKACNFAGALIAKAAKAILPKKWIEKLRNLLNWGSKKKKEEEKETKTPPPPLPTYPSRPNWERYAGGRSLADIPQNYSLRYHQLVYNRKMSQTGLPIDPTEQTSVTVDPTDPLPEIAEDNIVDAANKNATVANPPELEPVSTLEAPAAPTFSNLVPVSGNTKVMRCLRCNTFVSANKTHSEAECQSRIEKFATKRERPQGTTSGTRKAKVSRDQLKHFRGLEKKAAAATKRASSLVKKYITAQRASAQTSKGKKDKKGKQSNKKSLPSEIIKFLERISKY